jgi:CO/xanthine dehydrogenase Mo-binding subunit
VEGAANGGESLSNVFLSVHGITACSFIGSVNIVNTDSYEQESTARYDSGDYECTLNLALDLAGYAGLRREQVRARAEGRPVGIGVYLMPTIWEVPMTERTYTETPSPLSPMGVKGVGESAVLATPAALLSAINDALLPLGIQCTTIPASPLRLWQLIQSAKRGQQA